MTKRPDIGELKESVYDILVANGVAERFASLMRMYAEIDTRSLPALPEEIVKAAIGRISICYELADGAMAALEASETEAKVEEAERIQARLRLANELNAGGIP